MACARRSLQRLSKQLNPKTPHRASCRSFSRFHGYGPSSTKARVAGKDLGSPWGSYGLLMFGAIFVGTVAYNTNSSPVLADTPSSMQNQELRSANTVTSSSPMRQQMENLIREEQEQIITALEKVDGSGKKFLRDSWERPNHGGGGTSGILQDGKVFEKAGVNISIVRGTLHRTGIEQMRAEHKSLVGAEVNSLDYFACGLSMVLHPKNPMAPTVHLNYRYFETSDPNDPSKNTAWWFGGGTDLTPSYLFPEDAEHFHKMMKTACDKHDVKFYPRFKKWCDVYFWLPHRRESRGVGGIFFDDLDESESTKPELFSFVRTCLQSFLPSYLPIIERRKNMPYTPEQKEWQQLRRGRYVEFNLMHDRGTKFGLANPSARVESILMSLPLTARWEYMKQVSVGSPEDDLMQVLRTPREWVAT